MKLSQINNYSFKAGTVHVCNINKETLYSYNAVKKFAEEKGMDLFIIKNNIRTYLSDDNMYTIISTKDYETLNKNICGIAYAMPNKKASAKEISVKIFNAVLQSIENFENRLNRNSRF